MRTRATIVGAMRTRLTTSALTLPCSPEGSSWQKSRVKSWGECETTRKFAYSPCLMSSGTTTCTCGCWRAGSPEGGVAGLSLTWLSLAVVGRVVFEASDRPAGRSRACGPPTRLGSGRSRPSHPHPAPSRPPPTGSCPLLRSTLGSLAAAVDSAVDEAFALVPRIADRDHTVWQDDPTEVADRLGWLDAPERAAELLPQLRDFAAEVVADGITDVVLTGMGGSSLYPEVLVRTFGSAAGSPRLHVLDSTDPQAVLRLERQVPWGATLVVAASKSGGTVETRAHLARFTERLRDVRGDGAGRQLVAITDPGSSLDALAREQGFRAVFHGQPDVGGRFSALTPFGLVPAALLGVDLDAHLDPAAEVLAAAASTDPEVNTGVVLGAVLAAAHREGRDKLTLLLPGEVASLGAWIEQLVAESTGKHGVGILPVLGEDAARLAERPATDRLVVALGDEHDVEPLAAAGVPVVQLPWSGPSQLPAEVARFEVATAVVGALLDINPFDQPDVQSAKTATTQVLEEHQQLPAPDDPREVLGSVTAGDYVALLGFVTPGGHDQADLEGAATRLRNRLGVPVTVGIGPRYLHSTGQLHKGGPDTGVFLVVVGEDPQDAEVPGQPYSFATLKRAQAAGDLQALRAAGRRVALVAGDAVRELS
ncbi:glucose-6-phosphate isomerase [Nitriliruptoraceae bacterium ZYF776]|nr:glucose-6-phosphate isomerase [Profundirhabdus halotolerans]